MIESSSSSGDSDSNNRLDIMNLMESKKPMVRFTVYTKLKKIMNSLNDQTLSDIDRRILRGLFVKHLKDFDEEQREVMSQIPLIDRLKKTIPKLILKKIQMQDFQFQ